MGGFVRDYDMAVAAQAPRKVVNIALVTAISQAGVVAWAFTPGYKFIITQIKTYCLAIAGTVTGNFVIGARTVAALTFTAATEVTATLSATLANIRGSQSEQMQLQYTTNGTGALTNGYVIVTYRFRPQSGEISPT